MYIYVDNMFMFSKEGGILCVEWHLKRISSPMIILWCFEKKQQLKLRNTAESGAVLTAEK